MAVGAYPGTFNPPTVAHLAIAQAARAHAGLERVDLIVSELPLGKEDVAIPSLEHRLVVLAAVASRRRWLGVRRSPARLLVDLARGYDLLVVGADKWAQVLDPAWYGGSEAARDDALGRLPPVLVVGRGDEQPPSDARRPGVTWLAGAHHAVSSTAVRAGHHEWMLPEAAEFDRRTGAWSDPGRYQSRQAPADGPSGAPVFDGPRPG